MADETEPPRKPYGFKQREFTRDNPLGPDSTPPVTAENLAKLAGPVTRTTPPPGPPNRGDPNDVQAVLEANRRAEKQSTGDRIEIREVPTSRRAKDYWMLLLGGNAVIIGSAVFVGGFAIVFGFAGIIIFSIGLTWVMWEVMGKY